MRAGLGLQDGRTGRVPGVQWRLTSEVEGRPTEEDLPGTTEVVVTMGVTGGDEVRKHGVAIDHFRKGVNGRASPMEPVEVMTEVRSGLSGQELTEVRSVPLGQELTETGQEEPSVDAKEVNVVDGTVTQVSTSTGDHLPKGFIELALGVTEKANKLENGSDPNLIEGTRFVDDSLWVEGVRFCCKRAYQLKLMAEVRSDRVGMAVAGLLENEEQAQGWVAKLQPLPQDQEKIEEARLHQFEVWWRSQPACQLESQGVKKDTATSKKRVAEQHTEEAMVKASTGTAKKGVVFKVNTLDTHTVLVTLGTIKGYQVQVLNDSGADASVMSEACAKRLGLRAKKRADTPTLMNPNGAPLKCLGRVETTITMAKQQLALSAYVVSDITIELLVGGDFLRRHSAVLSYAELAVSYNGVKAELHEEVEADRREYRRSDFSTVVAGEDIVLNGELVVTVRAVVRMDTSRIRSAKCWEFEPLQGLETTSGVMIPRAVVSIDEEGRVPVRVRQVLKEEEVITKGTVLGTLRTVREHAVRSITTADLDLEEGVEKPKEQGTAKEADEEKFAEFLKKTIAGLPAEVDETMKEGLVKVLTKHKATLCAKVLGVTNMTTFDVVPNPGGPVQQKDRRWSHEELTAMKEQIDGLKKTGMIEPSSSPWASRLVMVTKKDGSIRVCVDFREVNKLCKRDAYPAPQIEQTLDQLRSAKWFTSLDAEKGYYAFRLDQCSSSVPKDDGSSVAWSGLELLHGVLGRHHHLQRDLG